MDTWPETAMQDTASMAQTDAPGPWPAIAGRQDRSARLTALALAATLALALAGGCGFRLRGAVDIPPELNPLYIEAPAGSLVRESIAEQLPGGSASLAPGAAKAGLTLRIQGERRSSRVAATDSSGKVLAYDLRFDVTFDAVAPDGAQKLPPQTIDLVRTFDNPDTEVLGKQLEEETIYRELAIDAADRILMRLRTALRARARTAKH